MEISRQGLAFVVSAPSGGGKTTICRRVMDHLSNLEFSVSHTTRAPRVGERPGVDYHFTDESAFQRMVQEHKFLEWAHVHGRLYGTSHMAVEKRLAAGVDVLFEIDVQGGRQIAARLPQCVLVFIVPPSMAILEQRLRRRQSDPTQEIDRRLLVASDEIRQATFYSHWVINDDLDQAVLDVEAIVRAERLRHTDKQKLVKGFFAASQAG